MEDALWIRLVTLFLIPVLVFVATVPLHELGHLLFLRVAGVRGDITVKWFQFPSSRGVMGYVKIQNEALPCFWENHKELFYFLLGFSGSAGVAIALTTLLIVLSVFKIFLQQIADLYFVPVASMIVFNIIYATQEGFQHFSRVKSNPGGKTNAQE